MVPNEYSLGSFRKNIRIFGIFVSALKICHGNSHPYIELQFQITNSAEQLLSLKKSAGRMKEFAGRMRPANRELRNTDVVNRLISSWEQRWALKYTGIKGLLC